MRSCWLSRKDASDIIVVFGGWALGAAPFRHLTGAQDVYFVDDYRLLDNSLPALSSYRSRSLVACSFGVAAVSHWMADHGDPFDHKVAVNGTLYPTNSARGIPMDQVHRTATELSATNLARFARRCGTTVSCDGADIAALQAELLAICARGAAPASRFDKVWLATKDRIFPPANMLRAWAETGVTPNRIEAPHYPFTHWSHWEQVLL